MRCAPKILTAIAAAVSAFTAFSLPVAAQDSAAPGLMVVYGALAPAREGDVDLREQVFFSVPADLRDRLYIRVYDPEVSRDSDFILGRAGNSKTTFRVFGGAGAFSEAERPAPVEDGAQAPRFPDATPVTGPGDLIEERSWGSDRATNARWVNLTSLRAGQGEVIDGRAFFRIDVQGADGDDGNGFSLAVSVARDRNRAPEDLDMFSYMPTVRWSRGAPATRVEFENPGAGDLIVQNFDAANGSITITTDFADLPVRVSGQNQWTSDIIRTEDTNLAVSLLDGFETPNDVTLAVFDASGAPLPLKMPPQQAPDPSRPTAQGVVNALADCRSAAFDASQSFGQTPLSHRWLFGDGSRSDEPVIAHRYAKVGRYTARLEVVEEGVRPGRGAALELTVHIRNAPIAAPGVDIIVAPGEEVAFDATGSVPSDTPIARYLWNFGDGSTSKMAQTTKRYANPGLYQAILRVEDDSDHPCNFGVETRRVFVNFPPVAEAGTDQSAETGKPVILNAAASYDVDGRIRAYSWNMGDGTVLEGPTVTHAFQTPGLFRVMLTVTDDSGVANNFAVDAMQVDVNAPPEPTFDIPARPVSVSEVAVLDASESIDSDGEILAYIWDFGDGASGEGETVEYAWPRSGVFTVTLTVIDNSGTGSATQSVQREIVIDAAPVAEAGPDQYVTASEVTFDGSGSRDADGAISSYEWDFGDGATGIGPAPTHAYQRPGIYEVALVVRDDSTAPLNVDRDTMTVTINETPIADAGPPLVVAPGEEFVVSGRASVDPDGEIADYIWSFPDGSTARGQRALHALQKPGLHRIALTVRDDFRGGAASDDGEVLVTVNAQPVAKAGPDLLIAPGESVVFDAGQSYDPDGTITEYRWEFDDVAAVFDSAQVERAFPTPGIWSAQLIVTDDSGVQNATAFDDVTIHVNHAPVADAGPSIDTDRLLVELDGSGSTDADGQALIYRWDFGDGSPQAQGRRVSHEYPNSGLYPVTLWVDDGTGLANATAVSSTVVEINTRPVAEAGGNRAVCSGETILFDASNSTDPDGGLLLYEWDFGDGTKSPLVNPSKTYEFPGVYSVTLRVENETGTQHGTDIDRIAALVREGPIADAGPDMTVCTNQSVRFDGSGSTDADGAVNGFSWTFGDGGIASGERPVYVFEKPGEFTTTLTIVGEALGDCSPLDVDTAKITVLSAPEQKIAGFDRAAAGLPATFEAALDVLGGATPVSHRWAFSDGDTASGASVTRVFDEPGEYFITLTTELTGGNAGCSTIETIRNVIVNAPPQPEIAAPKSVAAGELVTFDGAASTDADGAITAFKWSFGDGQEAVGSLVSHVFEKPGAYEVRLDVTDDAGVGNSTISKVWPIVVNAAPRAALATPPPSCAGEVLSWTAEVVEGTDVSWNFGGQGAKTGKSVETTFDKPGLYPVIAIMNDGLGLANSKRREEVYVRINAAPVAMAGPDRTICPGDEVTFDASMSNDVDGAITEWVWSFSDGVTLTGETASRRFDAPGDLTVTLSVRDESGSACAVDTDSARILVNSPPVVDAGPDRTTPIGAAHDVLRFDASNARDPDGHGVQFTWDFGDDTSASGAFVRKRYLAPGAYTVRVEARDETELACGVGSDTAVVTATPRD